jgi:F-type H+-transporting ATPase subunit b
MALSAGVVAAPFRLVAQQPAPAVQSAPAAQAKDTAKPEGAKQEENETDQFRHSGLVQAAARALHLSVEATARTFEFINFGIVVLAIGIPLVRWLPAFLRKRAAKVREDIESARKVTEDANTRLSAIEAKLSGLGEEIQKFRVEVEDEMGRDEARVKSSLEEESARIVASAEQEIGSAAAQARRGLRNFATDLAIDQAARQLVLSPETDKALIAEFIGDVAQGGQN